MKSVRIREQNNAAALGDYSAQLQLAYKSADVKKACCTQLTDELAKIIRLCAPKNVFTHNLADKHDTHVSVALRVIEALRKLSPKERPQRVYSMEVWRSLDWLCDEDKVCFDTSQHPNLANALLGVYDSQIAGGKRYDSAAIGRRLANATFFASHDTDEYESLSYGLDITDLIYDENTSPQEFIASYIKKFENEVSERIKKLSI